MRYKVGVVTGTRAEYGLLKPVIQKMDADIDMQLCLIVTGTHLSEKYGYTIREIEQDGYEVSYRIDMKLTEDTSEEICNSMGRELQGFSRVLAEADLDILLLLGDRYEIMIAAVAAMIYRLPIAHIHGGELTRGLIDDAIRHSITKMSMLHFTSTEEYRRRIIQMGEAPERVFAVGALGIENIKNVQLLERKELCRKFGEIFEKPYVMVTYHPVTLQKESAVSQFEKLLNVIEQFRECNYVFTYANADMGGKKINKMIENYVEGHTNTIAFVSMGQIGYLSALKYCKMVVGNSSSGIIEAPSFHVPTINIGERQAGRVKAETVFDCKCEEKDMKRVFKRILENESTAVYQKIYNPYEKENTSGEILNKIKQALENGIKLEKVFYDIEEK